ncbi:sigma-70 family RNA polymerase sigma factor [Jatrophihabitans sp.]|uniref:sigma-70 family RNA polymerase sigma factor n=1 Tax=Jatrophihabitans sp. TaxID=1932789 RepID=UPI002CC93384|nr:sigma-70 family RNA polymerase sigma factor [Jatrophihabitans sp.]
MTMSHKASVPASAALVDSTAPACSAEVEALIRDNLALVGHIVRETMTRLPAHIGRDDLISAGMTALVLSAQSYDEARGVPFARFAAIRIRGALVDELRSMDWASRSVRGRAREVETVRNQLAVTLARSPRPQEVADTLGVSVSELGNIDADVHRASVLSLQGFAPETGAAMVADVQRGPEQLVLDREQLGYLYDAIAELPERLRHVVQAYFFDQRQMADIAAELGVTESRISQLRAEALKLLRHGMAHAEPELAETAEPTGRAGARVASYAAAVAARGTLSSRLSMSNPLGETVTSYGSVAQRAGLGHTSIA